MNHRIIFAAKQILISIYILCKSKNCNDLILSSDDFQDPVGLESGAIPDSSLTASSAWTSAYKHCLPERARLHLGEERIGDDCGAWATAEIDSNPWIQVRSA